ncbi:flagellar biosynthetic protein FliO [Chryseomicrobium palamuruense]|uniref:Flagellar biosynthetic protein FliO n=1 Tax=Chryseomicrobium palamuruense TaxID=682973 RepID=A0ABV8UX16_9BACL
MKKGLMVILALWIVVLGSELPVNAATNPSVADYIKNGSPVEQPEEVPPAESTDRSLASIIGALIFYTLLIVGLIYLLIRFLATRQRSLQTNQLVQIMGGGSVGQQKSVQLVKVGNQVLVVGIGQDVTLLKEIEDEAEKARLIEAMEEQSELLKEKPKWLEKGLEMIRPKASSNQDSAQSFQTLFQQSLEKQKDTLHSVRKRMSRNEKERDE